MRRVHTSRLAPLIGFLLIGGATWAGSEPGPKVPFKLHRGHLIVVQGSIGQLKGRNFVIDTGATSTVISQAVARKLGLKGRAHKATAFGRRIALKKVLIPEIRLGGFRFPAVTALIHNLHFFQGIRVDALIGLDLLKISNLGIDFSSKTLSFGEMSHSVHSMNFYTKAPYVMLRMEVDGVPLCLKLDSGAGTYLLLYRGRVNGRFAWRLTDEFRTVRHLGGKAKARKVFLIKVRMADTEWGELAALLLTERQPSPGTLDGAVGLGALGLSNLQIDFQRGLMSWAK